MMALLTGALIAPELMAQQNPNRQQRPPRQGQTRDRNSRMAEELKLTEKQQEQWAKVNADSRTKQTELFQNRDVPIEKRREQFAALRKETQEKLEKILTKISSECGVGVVHECPILDALFEQKKIKVN